VSLFKLRSCQWTLIDLFFKSRNEESEGGGNWEFVS
jgi:hypothetical protein